MYPGPFHERGVMSDLVLSPGVLRPITDGKVHELALLELLRTAGWPVDDPTARFSGTGEDDSLATFTVHVGPRRGIVAIASDDESFVVRSYAGGGYIRSGDALPDNVRHPGLTHAQFLGFIEEFGLDTKIKL